MATGRHKCYTSDYRHEDVHGDIITDDPCEPLTTLCELDHGTNFNQDRYLFLVSMTTGNASIPVDDTRQDLPSVNNSTNVTIDDHGY